MIFKSYIKKILLVLILLQISFVKNIYAEELVNSFVPSNQNLSQLNNVLQSGKSNTIVATQQGQHVLVPATINNGYVQQPQFQQQEQVNYQQQNQAQQTNQYGQAIIPNTPKSEFIPYTGEQKKVNKEKSEDSKENYGILDTHLHFIINFGGHFSDFSTLNNTFAGGVDMKGGFLLSLNRYFNPYVTAGVYCDFGLLNNKNINKTAKRYKGTDGLMILEATVGNRFLIDYGDKNGGFSGRKSISIFASAGKSIVPVEVCENKVCTKGENIALLAPEESNVFGVGVEYIYSIGLFEIYTGLHYRKLFYSGGEIPEGVSKNNSMISLNFGLNLVI